MEKVRRKKMQVREKVRKSRFTAFFQSFGAPEGQSNLAKMAGAEPAGQMKDEKVHAVVARSTFPSQKCQKPTVSDHFWKLRCRKSARRCGAKHISKSNVSKTQGLRPLLEVQLSKKCTPLWQSTFPSQKCQSTRSSDHFWKLRCRKSARCCGAKHISKSKVSKTEGVRATL